MPVIWNEVLAAAEQQTPREAVRWRWWQIVRRVPEGQTLPRGYGMAYREWQTYHVVCLPLGLHVVVHVARRAWHRFRSLTGRSVLERVRDRAYAYGHADGYQQAVTANLEALDLAYHRGYKAGTKTSTTELVNVMFPRPEPRRGA
jgi:hypothetical protein